jgi:hypothetical protein
VRGEEQHLGFLRGRGQRLGCGEDARRREKDAGIGLRAERTVDVVEKLRTEAAGEPVARQRETVAHGYRADVAEQRERFGCGLHRFERQAGQARAQRVGMS